MTASSKLERIRKNPRLEGALWRGWNEVHAALNARELLLEIHEPRQTKIDSRKGIIFAALEDGIKMRLARLMDRDNRSESAGFSYVRRCWPDAVAEVVRAHSVDLPALDDIADRLTGKRDLTLFHIDKHAIGGAARIWQEQPITWREVDFALGALRIIYSELYEKLTGNKAPLFHLTGKLPSRRRR